MDFELENRDELTKSQRSFCSTKVIHSTFEGTESREEDRRPLKLGFSIPQN
jgi:hypothetical protein